MADWLSALGATFFGNGVQKTKTSKPKRQRKLNRVSRHVERLEDRRMLDADGVRDDSFSGNGIDFHDFGSRDEANDVAVQRDGKIVVVGSAVVDGYKDFALLRYKANGELDRTFGGDAGVNRALVGRKGEVITNFGGNRIDLANCVAIQADGKIVVAGLTLANEISDFAIARYNTDGSLDATFSGDGLQRVSFGHDVHEVCFDVSIQSNGKIVLVGASRIDGNENFAIARLTSSGALDTSFDSNGKVVTDFISGEDDAATDVAIQSNGRIVVAGRARGVEGGGEQYFAVARYRSNGDLDDSFSSNGKAIADFGEMSEASIAGIAIQSDGRIVVAGSAFTGGISRDFAAARFTAGGSLDTSFGTRGKLVTDFGSDDIATGIALQSNGRIVVAGLSGASFAVVRYTSDGILDDSFSGNGKLTTSFGENNLGVGTAITIQRDGKIVVVRTQLDEFGQGDFAIVRYA